MRPSRPGDDEHSPTRNRLAVAGSAVLLTGALAYIGVADPHNPDSAYPQCPFKWLTGWNCPACGGLRMTHDLLHGHFAASVHDNVFLLLTIPLLAAWILLRRHRAKSWLPVTTLVTVVVLATAWTVVRNLPGFPLVPTVLGG
ncbi:DUF2752 domain-containing protein [Mycobacterium vicinigordonae]|uniref:DUF2752 domain-containing protein n=1 Tax=Mycobacterium vicinigordonae TaxID=1719132 RepID=A0A7D6IB93_9MYCO|nr:DUF2752 domain-containing protein [Mycobacterium vicinigordonae]QLL10196.1 DUF2752 domain-containing protein [Mycobacterium vicinigordonae]